MPRKSISIRGPAYDRLRAYCEGVAEATGRSLAIGPIAEHLITTALDAEERAVERAMAEADLAATARARTITSAGLQLTLKALGMEEDDS